MVKLIEDLWSLTYWLGFGESSVFFVGSISNGFFIIGSGREVMVSEMDDIRFLLS